MILIGQYNSSFVRRVGIALTLYGLPFEHRPWSVFGDADKIRAYNPLVRVPTLVLDDGEVLIESHSILDYLDSLVPADQAMFPRAEPARHQALKVAALATGLADKAVSLFYEQRLHKEASRGLDRPLPCADRGYACRAGGRPRQQIRRLLVRRPHRPRRRRRGCCPASPHRVAPWAGFDGGLSGTRRSGCTARSAARLPEDFAAVHPADLSATRRGACICHRHQTAAAKLAYENHQGRVVNVTLDASTVF